MTDSSTGPAGDARLERFDAALDQIGHRASANDRRWALAGLVAMAAGIVVGVVAYSTSTSMSDQRDVISAVILGVVGLAVVVAGAAVFVRYSLTEFLRFWMLRMLLEQADEDPTSKDG
jgi:hypothetical protein